MKTLLYFASSLLLLFAAVSSSYSQQDTLLIKFGDQSKITVYVADSSDAEALRNLDLNALMKEIFTYIDSARSQEKDIVVQSEWGTVKVEENDKEKLLKLKDIDDAAGSGLHKSYTISVGGGNGITVRKQSSKEEERTTRHFIALDLGLCSMLDANYNAPSGTNYDLRPYGSRYFNIGSHFRTKIGGAKNPLALQYGWEISWYNFMFEGNQYITKTPTGVEFLTSDIPLKKTKLTVPYVSIPLMVKLDLGDDDKSNLKLGFGGHVGYRLGSYSKTVSELDGEHFKEKEHLNFHLNDLRYGVRVELGFGTYDGGVTFFGNYDLNTLFRENKGPNVQALSFGIRI